MKRKWLSKLFKFGLPLVGAAIIPTVISSCASTATTYTRTLNSSNWNNGSAKYSSLSKSKVSLESALYGSSYNKGNYVFIWGTLADSSVANFLYGSSGVDLTSEKDLSNSTFLRQFFNESGLGSGTFAGYSVSLLMFIDNPPYDGSVTDNSAGRTGYNSPTDKYTIDSVLKEANGGSEIGAYTEATLPVEYQLKVGNYMRSDKSAVTYREFIQYVKQVRPTISSPESSGIIAFKKGKKPQSYSISDSSTLISSLKTYYTPSAND